MTMRYLVDGPGNKKWSIWDFGDEMTVQNGRKLTSDVVARVPQWVASKISKEHRWDHVVDAAGAIRVAVLLGSDSPTFHKLWR